MSGLADFAKGLLITANRAEYGHLGRREEKCTTSSSPAEEGVTNLETSSGCLSGIAPATPPSTASDESLARRSGVRIALHMIEYFEAGAARWREILAKL